MAVKSTTGQGSTSSTSNVDALTTCAYILSSYTVTIVNTPNIWQGIQKLWYTLKKEKIEVQKTSSLVIVRLDAESEGKSYPSSAGWHSTIIPPTVYIYHHPLLFSSGCVCIYVDTPSFLFVSRMNRLHVEFYSENQKVYIEKKKKVAFMLCIV